MTKQKAVVHDGCTTPAISVSVVATATALVVLVLTVYLNTLFPSVSGGDSGELLAASCSLGMAHPPGYPLFVILNRVFSMFLFFFGTPALHANIFSALCGTAAALVVFFVVHLWTRDCAAAFLAAGLFAFSPLVWLYSVQAEVFALNNLLCALLLWCFVWWSKQKDARALHLAALVTGLAVAHQHTLFLYIVPMAAYVYATGGRSVGGPGLAKSLARWFGLGFCPYVLVWLLGLVRTPMPSWGSTTNPLSWLAHILRFEYGTFQLANPAGLTEFGPGVSLTHGLGLYARDLFWQQSMFGVVLALVGCYASLLRDAKGVGAAHVLAACYVFYLFVFHSLANLPLRQPLFLGIHARFWMQPNLLLFVWAGLGFAHLFAVKEKGRYDKPLAVLLAVFLVGCQISTNIEGSYQGGQTLVPSYARQALQGVPDGAVVLAVGDLPINPLLYLQTCEGFRPDVVVLSLHLLSYEWYSSAKKATTASHVVFPGSHYGADHSSGGYSLQQFFDANIDERPVFIFGGRRPYPLAEQVGDASLVPWQFAQFPHGLLDRVYRVGPASPQQTEALESPPDLTAVWLEHRRALDGLQLDTRPESPAWSWERQAFNDLWLSHHRMGWHMLSYAMAYPNDKRRMMALQYARASFEAVGEQAVVMSAYGWGAVLPREMVLYNLYLTCSLLNLQEDAWRLQGTWLRYTSRHHEKYQQMAEEHANTEMMLRSMGIRL